MENDYANSIDIEDIDYGYEGEITDGLNIYCEILAT